MFKTRLISGIILVIIALATIISGSWILFFTLLVVSLIGMRELYKVMKVSDEHITVLELVGYLGAVLYYIAMKFDLWNNGDHHQYDPDSVCLCIRLSEIPCGTSDGSIFRSDICCGDAFLYLSYQKPPGRKIPGMADLLMLLGL